MMFERFTGSARHIVVRAQSDARRLGHNYIGSEHLLLAAAASDDPAGAILREQGVTPERVEAEIVRTIGRGYAADALGGLDREALAAIGIDLDVVRARIEAAFGPDALTRAAQARKHAALARGRRVWRRGPARPIRIPVIRRARRAPVSQCVVPPAPGNAPLPPGPPHRGRIPFTPRAKKALELSLREAVSLKDNFIGVQHFILALLAMKDGMVPAILSALGASPASLRTAILDRYRKAS